MKTQIFTKEHIAEAAALLKKGELIAFPTETVYGLGANALDEKAVSKVYQVKGRPSDNPLIVHVDSFDQVKQYISTYPEFTEKLIEAFWPGPLTLIFPIKSNVLPAVVTGGLSTAAFRMPKNQTTLTFIQETGLPMVGPSANTSGKPSPTTAAHVYHDLQGKIAGILDDGATEIGVESTVLDLTDEDGVPVILRPGAITVEDLLKVVPEVKVDKHLLTESEAPKAPGMKYTHYSPDTPVFIIDGEKERWQKAIQWAKSEHKRIGIFADELLVSEFRQEVNEVFSFGEKQAKNAAKYLFAGLRSLDEKDVDVIFAQAFLEKEIGTAYMNRLKKAAGQKYF